VQHSKISGERSEKGHFRKSAVVIVTSGLPLEADSSRTSLEVRFVPISEVGPAFPGLIDTPGLLTHP
jgi:hypothetical protein